MNQQNRILITVAEANKVGGALQRLAEIGDAKILSPDLHAERDGLRQWLAEYMTGHASEFLGCWLAMHNEYEPLIMGFTSLLNRANSVIRAQHAAVAAAAEEQQPDNVIQLDSAK